MKKRLGGRHFPLPAWSVSKIHLWVVKVLNKLR